MEAATAVAAEAAQDLQTVPQVEMTVAVAMVVGMTVEVLMAVAAAEAQMVEELEEEAIWAA